MTGTLLTDEAAEFGDVWQSYWQEVWHHNISWPAHRLACFLSAEEGRTHSGRTGGDGLVSDFPRGRRPFLGAITNSARGTASAQSGVLEYNDDGHLLTIAPTRSGKGVGQIIPNLLLYAGSCLVIDIKGENYALTAEHRANFFTNAQVWKFAPFDEDTAHYNPLDFIRVSPSGEFESYTFDDCRLLAEMLIPGNGSDDFWDVEARGVLTMLLIYVSTKSRPGSLDRSMRAVVKLLSPPTIDDTVDAKVLAFDGTLKRLRNHADFHEILPLQAMVTQFSEHDPKLRANILSSCRGALAIWLSPRLLAATDTTDFQFSDLKRSMCRPIKENPAPTSIYICIPPEYLREYRTVLRMMVGLAAVELTRVGDWTSAEKEAAGWFPKPPCPVLFVLDEFPSLGYMAPIADGVAYLAGYGVQIWTFAQSLGQLQQIYKDNWTTFISNAGAACYFGATDPDLCEYLSKQLGTTEEYEIRYETRSTSNSSSSGSSSSWSLGSGNSTSSSNDGSSSSNSVSENVRHKQDPVATASDIRAMPVSLQLILLRGKRPVLASLVPFFACEIFQDHYNEWRN